ncbi:MAG TPA: 3-dehydroquinate synthase [Burkholderiales bacterium]|nr:3-dehydroquinate synthase [Burkholderiales bacterium]
MESLRVALRERTYPIHIGAALVGNPALYAPHLTRSVAIVTNEAVAAHYLSVVQGTVASAGARVTVAKIPDGEHAKAWDTVDAVCDRLLADGCGRDTLIVALGGGVVGDLAGFVAAVYQRGIPFLQVPTTLLAQVDSSVGGKTAINHARGKNMIGAFHQPVAVIADVATLQTLPERELRAGLAEVIKHGAALDAEFFGWLEANIGRLLARDPQALVHAVRRSCALKAGIVAADERETGVRALLNFGHTFGHAIEAAAGYGAWLHGEAVAAGMVMAAELSRREAGLSEEEAERLRALVQQAGLPVNGPPIDPERLVELMAVDKKAAGGKVRFVVLNALGSAQIRSGMPDTSVRAAILAASQ